MNNIISITYDTPREVALSVADRVRQRRLELNLTQEGLCVRAGIKVPTYRKFERTGDISLRGLLSLAFALDCLDDFSTLFSRKKYQSLEELVSEKITYRKRGHYNE